MCVPVRCLSRCLCKRRAVCLAPQGMFAWRFYFLVCGVVLFFWNPNLCLMLDCESLLLFLGRCAYSCSADTVTQWVQPPPWLVWPNRLVSPYPQTLLSQVHGFDSYFPLFSNSGLIYTAADSRRKVLAHMAGQRIVQMVREDLTIDKVRCCFFKKDL